MKASASIRKWAWLSFVLVVTLGELLWSFTPPPRAWVERWYSQGLFPAIASWLVPAVGVAPFSLSVSGLALVSILLVVGGCRGWLRRRKVGESAPWVLGVGACRVFTICVIGYGAFLVIWGAGYGRERLETRLELGSETPTVADVLRWVARLSGRIASSFPEPGARDREAALASLREALVETLRAWDGREPALSGRVKDLPPGSLLSFGTSGVTVPFFLEAHIDSGLHETEWLAVAAHELAHVAGYCAEADADFVAAVAGLSARNSYARYSVELWLFQKMAAALPESESRSAHAALPPGARDDLKSSQEAHSRHRIDLLARAQSRAYDAYLRSQRLEEGLKEYSTVVRLLVKAERKDIVRLD